MVKTLQELPQHPMRSLLPPLGVMEKLGHATLACLQGTGILLSQLRDPIAGVSLQQELAFYRNMLKLSGDPAIGLKLGEPFVPQRYGLFGYAMLSAATFRHALALTENFGRLTFSFFTLKFGVDGKQAWFSLSEPPPFEQELVDVYLDRDMSAGQVDFSEILGMPFPLTEVHLTHDGHRRQQVYRDHFGAPVYFGAEVGKFVFDSASLDAPLPQSDPETSLHFQQQCQMLLAKLVTHGQLVDHVRMIIISRPGFFPDIDYVAEKLDMSSRTLRRRLREEGSSYRQILDEIRFELSREYLANTELPIDEISVLLGYSEPGNFCHAFRRWGGQPPSSWRLQYGEKSG
jgi:AraC-like DNA-binding protein